MDRIIIIFITCVILAICVILAATSSNKTDFYVWDGAYPSGLFELKVKNRQGHPIQGAKFDIYEGNSKINAYEQPFKNYDQGAKLISDKDGIIRLYSEGMRFGGTMEDKPPQYTCSISFNGNKEVKFDASNIFDEK
ncbi:hypothetical protein ACFLYZ_00815, partial [Thermodesulfobacteriota bacterium]